MYACTHSLRLDNCTVAIVTCDTSLVLTSMYLVFINLSMATVSPILAATKSCLHSSSYSNIIMTINIYTYVYTHT